jgi:peptidoglycan/xylan/chitin deacetylase (PgdA/CDA1 family)
MGAKMIYVRNKRQSLIYVSRILLVSAFVLAANSLPAHAQQIAFTWDDLPAHSILPPGETRVEIGRKIVSAMRDAHMPPIYGFVNGIHTEREPLSTPMLKEWRDAGLPLGNHTWSHMNLNQRSLADWEADVLNNEPLLQSYMGNADWHWLRYPYLAEGDTAEKRDAARKFLAEHGYKIAAVTMSFADYMYNEPYARCVAKNDPTGIAQLEKSYLDAADAYLGYSRAMSKALYGRDIPYVLLMHVGAIDARLLPQLLQLYRQRAVTFISLEDAEKDPFYKNDLDLSLPATPDTLEQAMQARGLPLPDRPHADLDVNAVCR